MYPFMDAKVTKKLCHQIVMESEIEINDVNYREAVRFIAMKHTIIEDNNHTLRRFIPRRKHKNGVRPLWLVL